MTKMRFGRMVAVSAVVWLMLGFWPAVRSTELGAGLPGARWRGERSDPPKLTFAPVFFISTTGRDSNPGTAAAPFATLDRARLALRTYKRPLMTGPIVVQVGEGTYRLDRTLVFTPEDSGIETAYILFTAAPGVKVTLSGSRKIEGSWKPYKDGLLMCELPASIRGEVPLTQLFVNGKRQTLARFPNRDDSRPGQSGYLKPAKRIPDDMTNPNPGADEDMTFSGGAPRGILYDPATFTARRWARPEEAVIHIYQGWGWGNMQWRLAGVDAGTRAIWFGAGGWQMGAKWFEDPAKIEAESRYFVENVFEELDAPGEWYLDNRAGVLYYKPEAGVDMARAIVGAEMPDNAAEDSYDMLPVLLGRASSEPVRKYLL